MVEADVKAVAVMNTVDAVDAVEPETATKVSALIAKLTAIIQMQAENANALRMEETMISAFGSSAGSHAMSR